MVSWHCAASDTVPPPVQRLPDVTREQQHNRFPECLCIRAPLARNYSQSCRLPRMKVDLRVSVIPSSISTVDCTVVSGVHQFIDRQPYKLSSPFISMNAEVSQRSIVVSHEDRRPKYMTF